MFCFRRKWKKEGQENFHEVYEDHKQEKRVIQERHQKENLYAQIGRLTTQINWLKKNLVLTTSKSERKQMIEKKNEKISLKEQATLLSLSRSGLYYRQCGVSPKEIATNTELMRFTRVGHSTAPERSQLLTRKK